MPLKPPSEIEAGVDAHARAELLAVGLVGGHVVVVVGRAQREILAHHVGDAAPIRVVVSWTFATPGAPTALTAPRSPKRRDDRRGQRMLHITKKTIVLESV